LLTADLVTVRQEGDQLSLRPLEGRRRARALELAELLLLPLATAAERRREDLEERFADVPVGPTEHKLADGLKKLILDRCEFVVPPGPAPPLLRQCLFRRAAARRRELGPGESLDREQLLQEVAAELELSAAALEERLFADRPAEARLQSFRLITAAELVRVYDLSQVQAVLLRAVRVVVEVRAPTAVAYRQLFRKLKFLQLLCVIEPLPEGGYRITVDGPLSLFSAVTRYGLQLALLLPALEETAAPYRLEAQVKWGQDRRTLTFRHARGEASGADGPAAPPAADLATGAGSARPPVHLPDDLQRFVAAFDALGSSWDVQPASAILHLPGLGVCLPDLLFRDRQSGAEVHLEVLGFWSRAAVWRRVDLVRAGLPQRILFAVSSRLRVSEAALPEDLPGELLVYKGVLNPRRVLERLEARRGSGRGRAS